MGAAAVFDLDEPEALDPKLVGAKAASLARARAAGLPVLPGCAVSAAAGSAAFAAGADALETGGSGAARMAVMSTAPEPGLVDELVRRLRGFAAPVVVRSSSAVEADSEWAGAFNSLAGIGSDELSTALRGVWASAFSVDALERCRATGVPVTDVGLAVLVQPEISPECGGTARLHPDGSVRITLVSGGPQGLLGGYERGDRVILGPDGARTGPAVDTFGADVVDAIGTLSRRVGDRLDLDLIEWALDETGVRLLQAGRGPAVRTAPALEPLPAAFGTSELRRIAALVRRFPGALGERLVLPWALAARDMPFPEHERSLLDSSDDPQEALRAAMRLSERLITDAWQLPAAEADPKAAKLLRTLRGPEPDAALSLLAELAPVNVETARQVVSLLHSVASAAATARKVPTAEEAWQHPPERLLRILDGQECAPALRIGPDLWEPFVHQVVVTQGQVLQAEPVVPGVGTGTLRWVSDVHHSPPRRAREVIVAPRPVPTLSSQLWTAAGLVTGLGDAAAHLFEVADSLGVPAVMDAELEAFRTDAPPDGQATVLAVDGERGCCWSLLL